MDYAEPSQPAKPSDASPISQPKLLVGEGSDEVKVFTKLLKNLNITDVQVEGCGSKDKLGKYLKGLRGRSGFRRLQMIGIVRDADDNPAIALDSTANLLKDNGFSVVRKSGGIVEGVPSVGVFVVGDGNKTKMLEDLCLAATINQEAVWNCIDDYFACLKKREKMPSNLSKARFSTWLAVQQDANTRGLGGAAEKETIPLFDWNSEAFAGIKSFLTRLFNNPAKIG
jgi:hypothetical protein